MLIISSVVEIVYLCPSAEAAIQDATFYRYSGIFVANANRRKDTGKEVSGSVNLTPMRN